jgi:HAE1 family hydrophobic/amphiphilic exporter-1
MQAFIDVFIRRPVFASMLIAALVVLGGASFLRLPVDRFPSVDLPTVSVRTTLPGASTEEVETLISQRIEEAVNTIEGIDQLRSISFEGRSTVLLTFNLGRDIDTAAQDVRDRVATVLRDLPPEAEPPIIAKFDNDQSPVLTLALFGQRPLRELTEIADKLLKPALERSVGVGEVLLNGGAERAIKIELDAERLASYQIPVQSVREAVRNQNAEVPGGNLTSEFNERVLRTAGRIQDPADFAAIVVGERGGQPVYLGQVARIEDGAKEQRSLNRYDGQPCVTLEIRRQSGANTVLVIDAIQEKLTNLRASLPADLELNVVRDQSRYIRSALHEIELHLVLGSILASLVVLFFMKSWRSTLIAAVAIPTSTIACFAVMDALGFTLNGVTMLALVLMVGVVIDDAIVVLENIFRFVEEEGKTAFEAAREGTAEIALAVMATTLSLAVIFVPVSFMSSISGRFLYQFGITCAAAVMVSLLVSFVLTPTMSARLLRVRSSAQAKSGHRGADGLPSVTTAHLVAGQEGHAEASSRRGFYAWLERSYLWSLRLALRFRPLVALLALLTVAATLPIYRGLPQEYTPTRVDEGEFEVNINGPEAVNLEAMDGAVRAVEAIAARTPGIAHVLATTGGGFSGRVNQGSLYLELEPYDQRIFTFGRLWRSLLDGDPAAAWRERRSQGQIMLELRKALRALPEVRCSVRNAQSFNLGGGPFEIDFSILGPDLAQLEIYGQELKARADALGGIADPDVTLRLDAPELVAVPNRVRAADLSVEMGDVAAALRLLVGGELRLSRFRDPQMGEEYDVELRLKAEDRDRIEALGDLLVPSRDGRLVRLDQVVELVTGETATRVDRMDRQRQVSLRASVGPGYALADRVAALRGAAAEMNLPPTYSTRISGRGRELERTFNEFLWAFGLSVLLMYLVLASQFESLVHPLTILLSLPLSVPFALWSLDITGSTLNLYSALGILVLFGVVKKNAILQVDHTLNLVRQGLPRHEAILRANRDRLRPILMTTLALVAGMLPLALGNGPGAEERRAVAIVVIGGQTLSLLLTLLITPIAYTYFDDLAQLFRRRRPHPRPGTPASLPAAGVATSPGGS